MICARLGFGVCKVRVQGFGNRVSGLGVCIGHACLICASRSTQHVVKTCAVSGKEDTEILGACVGIGCDNDLHLQVLRGTGPDICLPQVAQKVFHAADHSKGQELHCTNTLNASMSGVLRNAHMKRGSFRQKCFSHSASLALGFYSERAVHVFTHLYLNSLNEINLPLTRELLCKTCITPCTCSCIPN